MLETKGNSAKSGNRRAKLPPPREEEEGSGDSEAPSRAALLPSHHGVHLRLPQLPLGKRKHTNEWPCCFS